LLTGLFQSIAEDIRFAFRMMKRSPGLTAMAVLSLGLGWVCHCFDASYSRNRRISPRAARDARGSHGGAEIRVTPPVPYFAGNISQFLVEAEAEALDGAGAEAAGRVARGVVIGFD
jgi:hypothetical protein